MLTIATTTFAASYTASNKALSVAKTTKTVKTPNLKPVKNGNIIVNGTKVTLKDPIMEANGRTYLPLRALPEALGKQLD